MTHHTLLIALALLLTSDSTVGAESVWPAPVQRSTNDRDADLLAELSRLGRYDEAAKICRSSLDATDPESDAAARWAIRLSMILSAAQMSNSAMEDQNVAQAQQPVTDLLAAYPQHRRGLFLAAQRIAVERDAARNAIVAASVSTRTNERIDRAMKRLSRATVDLGSLARQVGDARTRFDNEPDRRSFALIGDLVRLQQELQIDVVSLSLMQTELFPVGSQDRLGAATRAEAAAEDAATKLPADSPARREVERLRIEAIIRGQQFQRAGSELAELTGSLPKPIPANIQAMQIRIDIAVDRLASAKKRILAFYAPSSVSSSVSSSLEGSLDETPLSIEMDLARLEYLLASNAQNGEIGRWLDSIERRGGLYARRRGESISLAKLRSADHSRAVDPSLVAAQAQDWVRRGDHRRAGELFSAAAIAELDDDRAIRHAVQAAAAFMKTNRSHDAADILESVALAHRNANTAPGTHLQAAVLHSSRALPDSANKVEAILLANLKRWPASKHAAATRRWLVKLLSAQQRHVEAAEAATRIDPERLAAGTDVKAIFDVAVDLWRTAIRSAEPETVPAILDRFRNSFQPLLTDEPAQSRYRSAAAYLLDRESLADLPPARQGDVSSGVSSDDPYAAELLAFRLSEAKGSVLGVPPESVAELVVWRLMRDGRFHPPLRPLIAAAISSWPSMHGPSMEQAERLLWLGRVPDAVKMLRQWIGGSTPPGDTIREAAALLGSSDLRGSKMAAIDLWDRLSAGIPQGSSDWHTAKLASIHLLGQLGKRDEARRRAKYILLTTPPSDAEQRQLYQSTSGPGH